MIISEIWRDGINENLIINYLMDNRFHHQSIQLTLNLLFFFFFCLRSRKIVLYFFKYLFICSLTFKVLNIILYFLKLLNCDDFVHVNFFFFSKYFHHIFFYFFLKKKYVVVASYPTAFFFFVVFIFLFFIIRTFWKKKCWNSRRNSRIVTI